MSTYTQEGRWLEIQTPLGDGELLLRGFTFHEEISRLYHMELQLVSLNGNIAAPQIVGHNISVKLLNPDQSVRYFHGFVSRFSYRGTDDRLSIYHADVVPWTWFLTQTRDCRIFQNKTIPQILEQVLSGYDGANFEIRLTGQHPVWEYCVQYRESDFDFISRLMEQEGICYYFRHEETRHVMVLSDSRGGYGDCTDSQVSMADNLSGGDLEDLITHWEHNYTFRPSRYTQTDYNFERPSANLLTTTPGMLPMKGAPKTELYDFPGEYEAKPDGDAETRIRMEEVEATYDTVTGKSKCRSFFPGGRFTLSHHHSEGEAGKQYVLVSVHHEAIQAGGFVTGGAAPEFDYRNSFTCIPSNITFRPERRTPKPQIKGIQTATVVGPKGEEIYTDKYGRVKVRFHWDRTGKSDDTCSCWIRVSQAWAGNNWGVFFLPRIGHEVIISFLEGDPDRPLITGAVHNAEQMPPYPLPDNQTVSTLKTLSSPGAGGFNEIRFEDKKGKEQIYIHAERDLDLHVKNQRTENVVVDRHLTVHRDKLEHVCKNRHELVDGQHFEAIKGDRDLTVGGEERIEVGKQLSVKVGGDVVEVFSQNHSEKTEKEIYLSAENICLEASNNITLMVGDSYIAIQKNGIRISTTGQIMIDAASTVDIKASGVATLQGSLVKIN